VPSSFLSGASQPLVVRALLSPDPHMRDEFRFGHRVRTAIRRCLRRITYLRWLLGGPLDDAHSFAKRARLCALAEEFACSTFVETGTYLGDTVAAMRRHFARVLSVELSPELYQDARRRFSRSRNVSLFHGDSSKVLPSMLYEIVGRALFWLDGHYSGAGTAKGISECPLSAELAAIRSLARRDHVIVIDDARFLGEHADYPSLEVVRGQMLEINPQYHILLEDDWLIAKPPQPTRR